MILALIQARMTSARLPGKVMLPLAGIPLIDHVVKRTAAATLVDRVCVCIPNGSRNAALALHVVANLPEAKLCGGPEDDVLARFHRAIGMYPEAHTIVRITADDPYKDPKLIDHAIAAFMIAHHEPHELAGSPQYVLLGGPTWPTGMQVEVFTREALEEAHKLATKPEDREHVTTWIQDNKVCWVLKDDPPRRTSETRWTIDTREDYDRACAVYDKLYPANKLFGYEELLGAGVD